MKNCERPGGPALEVYEKKVQGAKENWGLMQHHLQKCGRNFSCLRQGDEKKKIDGDESWKRKKKIAHRRVCL